MGISPGLGPASDYTGILTGTGYTSYVERNRRHLMQQADALRDAAAALRDGIREGGKRYFVGIDVKWQTRKICKPMEHAAECLEQAAKAMGASQQGYREVFGSVVRTAAKVFDPTK